MTSANPSQRAAGAARVRAEHQITVEEAQLLFPEGKRPSLRTLVRWIVRGRGGVRLDAAKKNGSKVTSIEAVRRFRAATGLTLAGWLADWAELLGSVA